MKKLFPYILIVFILVQLLAPFTVGLGTKNNLEVRSNKAEAGWILPGKGVNPISIDVQPARKDTSIRFTITVSWPNKSLLSTESVIVSKIGPDGETYIQKEKVPLSNDGQDNQIGSVEFLGLSPGTTYKFDVIGTQTTESLFQAFTVNLVNRAVWLVTFGGLNFGLAQNTGEVKNDTPYEVTTLTTPTTTYQDQEIDNSALINDATLLPVCAPNNIGGCVGVILYRLVFQPSSYLFAITGKLLDYTLFYSIQDTSYRSQFVVEGWGTVRDFVNMFFIFVLLYIAFGTILNLHSVKTKEMIINVVIIGLLINFSLFATQVIIDASNMLTRVFYNQILVGTMKNGVVVEELGLGGSKQVTAALVSKINPQQIIIHAGEAGKIPAKGVNSTGDDNGNKSGVDNGTFILVTIMASIMNIVGLWTFLMVSIIFVARVVGLWVAMILVPLAFFSYTVPSLQDIDMIGWKKWWPETIKLAFLAPVFIFFLYLIIQFLDSGLGVLDANGKTGLDFFIAILVPFAFLMILLIKAKDVTKKMSGTIGESLTNAIKTVGGVALGAGLGGLALAGRATIGRAGSAIANSEKLKAAEAEGGFKGFFAKNLRTVGMGAGSSSLDFRNTKAGAAAGKGMGVDMGKGKEGGFVKAKADQIAKSQKRAKELELGEGSNEKQALNRAKEKQKELEDKFNHDIEKTEGDVNSAREKYRDADIAARRDPNNMEKRRAADATEKKLKEEQDKLWNMKNGGEELDKDGNATGKYYTDNGFISQKAVDDANEKVKNATSDQISIAANIEEVRKAGEEAVRKAKVEIKAAEDKKDEIWKKGGTPAEKDAAANAIKEAQTTLTTAETNSKNDSAAAIGALAIAETALATAKINAERASKAASEGAGISLIGTKTDVHHTQKEVDKINNLRKNQAAAVLESTGSKVFNFITTGGQYSSSGANEVAHNIRMNVKVPETKHSSSHDSHGGGGGSHSAPKPA